MDSVPLRFEARHVGSGVWAVYDGTVMGYRGTDYGQAEAEDLAAVWNTASDQYGARSDADRRGVDPPVPVEGAAWGPVGQLEGWVREQGEWIGRVRTVDGRIVWIRERDLRPTRVGVAGPGPARDE